MSKKPPGYFKGRICCKCGNSETRMSWGGTPRWEYHKCNKESCTGYLCYDCSLVGPIKTREYLLEKRKNRKCCICGSSITYIDNSSVHHWYNHKCGIDGCTGFICNSCDKIIKRDADWRKGNLDPLSSTGKGFIGQQIVAKRYGVEDCNLKMNNFHFYVDLHKISEYGYGEVKIRSLGTNGRWIFDSRRDQEYDTLFLLCMDNKEPWEDVEKAYAISWYVVRSRAKASISITKNPSRGFQWYEVFEIDEKHFNDVYHNMKIEDCKVLRKKNTEN